MLLNVTNFFGQSPIDIAKKSIKSTVSIVALDINSQPLGHGSGFILEDELIVSNVHVVEGCSSAVVFLDGSEKRYAVNGYVAIDKPNDLIILKVTGLVGPKLPLHNEVLPEIGERVYAIGNPKGLTGTFSEGIVSGMRDIQSNKVIQITAPISPGSSGGPVLNNAGYVIGIAFASFSSGQNLNFAIPVKYLLTLKSKLSSTPTTLSSLKPQQQPTTQTSPNIIEGVEIRHLAWGCFFKHSFSFSIKNNLPNTISHVKILILVYDLKGVVVDYHEYTFKEQIKPNLARTTECEDRIFDMSLQERGYKLKARILDFKIIEN